MIYVLMFKYLQTKARSSALYIKKMVFKICNFSRILPVNKSDFHIEKMSFLKDNNSSLIQPFSCFFKNILFVNKNVVFTKLLHILNQFRRTMVKRNGM